MAQYLLQNQITLVGRGGAAQLGAGKLIDDRWYNIAAIQRVGGVLLPVTTGTQTGAALATKQHLRGHSPDADVGLLLPALVAPLVPAPIQLVRVNLTGTGGARPSPYAAQPGDTVVVDTSLGSVVVALPVLSLGQEVTVVHDAATSLVAASVTINAPAGAQIALPPPNNGTFGPSYVLTGVQSEGATLSWFGGGSSGGALIE